jgi:hypothetical protein
MTTLGAAICPLAAESDILGNVTARKRKQEFK